MVSGNAPSFTVAASNKYTYQNKMLLAPDLPKEPEIFPRKRFTHKENK